MAKHEKIELKLTEQEKAVLLKYDLIDAAGAPLVVDLTRPTDKPLGVGPKLEPTAIRKLLDADFTAEKAWIDWIFFQAGGGHRGREASKRAGEQLRERYIKERTQGFFYPKTQEKFPPISEEAAAKRWEEVTKELYAELNSADQDCTEKLGLFGYYRHWPGPDNLYQNIVDTLAEFVKLKEQRATMNKELEAEGNTEDVLLETPEGYPDLEAMVLGNKRTVRYFASKAARNDKRAVMVCDLPGITAICPLTHAAAVHYGHNAWPWANRESFEEVLMKDASFRDAWKTQTEKGSVIVHLQFKLPTPCWIVRQQSKFNRCTLENLALTIRKDALSNFDPSSATFTDEEGKEVRLDAVCKMLHGEWQRQPDAMDEEIPIKRGPNVYKTPEEGAKTVAALNDALLAIKAWAKKFDASQIQPLTLAGVEAPKE